MLDQAEIAQQHALLATYRRTLAHFLTQAAEYGGESFVPAQTAHGIHEAREHIRQIKATLSANGVELEDLPGDKPLVPQRVVFQEPALPTSSSTNVMSHMSHGDVPGGDTHDAGEQTTVGSMQSNVQTVVIAHKRVYRVFGIPIFSVSTSASHKVLFLIVTSFSVVLLAIINSAAAQSVPGEPLYPWKLAQERVALSLQRNPHERSLLHLEYAQRRLDEFSALIAEGNAVDPALLTDTLDNLLTHVQAALVENAGEVAPVAAQLISQTKDALRQAAAVAPVAEPLLSKQRAKIDQIEQQLPAPRPTQTLP